MARPRSKKDRHARLHSTYPFHKGPCDPECSKYWFNEHDILYIEPDKQREVVLNPGKDLEWFKKVYPIKGEVSLLKKVYIRGLPKNLVGKITRVTAIPKFKDKVKKLRDTIPYKEFSTRGLLKAKPLGTYYEFFEGGGYAVWTNPSEYTNVGNKKRPRGQNKRIPRNFERSGARIGDLENYEKRFSGPSRDHKKNNKTPVVIRKS